MIIKYVYLRSLKKAKIKDINSNKSIYNDESRSCCENLRKARIREK